MTNLCLPLGAGRVLEETQRGCSLPLQRTRRPRAQAFHPWQSKTVEKLRNIYCFVFCLSRNCRTYIWRKQMRKWDKNIKISWSKSMLEQFSWHDVFHEGVEASFCYHHIHPRRLWLERDAHLHYEESPHGDDRRTGSIRWHGWFHFRSVNMQRSHH